MYCWEIDRNLAKIVNRQEIEIALYKANKVVIGALDISPLKVQIFYT